jgi:hypothetical protein
MTPEQLRALLGNNDIHQTLDVKTLVIDIVRKKKPEELEPLFWENLDQIEEKQIQDYFFMSRG